MFFAKYDIDGDGELDGLEGGRLLDDIDRECVDVENRPKSGREARDLRSARIG